MAMKTTVKTITPEWAKMVLETKNPKNRGISKNRVKSFANDMRNGCWKLTHQGIAFDEDGNLKDGQHRLEAIVDYGKPVEMMVTTGMVSQYKNGILIDVMDLIDRGSVRSIPQQLSMSHGIKYSAQVSSGARTITMICGDLSTLRMTTGQVLHVIKTYGEHLQAVLETIYPIKPLRQSGIYATLAFCRASHGEVVDEFAEKLAFLDNIPAKSPVMALHRWYQNHTLIKNDGDRMRLAKATATCLKRYIDGETMDRVVCSDDAIDFFRLQQKKNVRAVLSAVGILL